MKILLKKKLKQINNGTYRGAETCKLLGLKQENCVICDHMLLRRFVIPDETRWECIQCGRCCINKEPITLPKKYDHKPDVDWRLREDGACADLIGAYKNIHDELAACGGQYKCNVHEGERPPICRRFPFGAVTSGEYTGLILTIDVRCAGVGEGEPIDDARYEELLNMLKEQRDAEKKRKEHDAQHHSTA